MKDEIESWLLSLAKKVETISFYVLILFLPTQFGKHFWFDFSFVLGLRVDYLSPTLYVTDVLILLLLPVFLRKKIAISPAFSLVLLFISLSTFLSASPFVGWYFLAKFLEMSFFAWYVAHANINKIKMGILLATGIFFECLLSFLQLVHQGSLGGTLYLLGERSFSGTTPGVANASVQGSLILRPYGTFSHPNMLAGYLVVGVLVIGYLLLSKVRIQQFILLCTSIVGTIGVAISLSRVGIVSWFLACGFLIALTFRERIAKNILLVVFSLLTVFLLTLVFFHPLLLRLLSFSFGQSLSERILLANSALQMILANPLFGVGPNNFISTLPLLAKDALILQPVHNIYLLIAAELGVPGLVIFVAFFFLLIRQFFADWKQKEIGEKNKSFLLLLAFYMILFSGLFDHYFLTLQQGQLLFALVVGLVFRDAKHPDTIQK